MLAVSNHHVQGSYCHQNHCSAWHWHWDSYWHVLSYFCLVCHSLCRPLSYFAPLQLMPQVLEHNGGTSSCTRVGDLPRYEEGQALVQPLPQTSCRALCLLPRALLHQEQLVSRSRMRTISITYEVTEQESVCFAAPQMLNARMTFVGRREDILKVVLGEDNSSTMHMIWHSLSLYQIL